MNLGEILLGGAGALLTPAGLVLIPPAVALALALAPREVRPARAALAGPGMLTLTFLLAAAVLRPAVFPTPLPAFSVLAGAGFHRDAALVGAAWLVAGGLVLRRGPDARGLPVWAWAVGGALLTRLIAPVQGPVLAVVNGPVAAVTPLGPRIAYYAGFGVGAGVLCGLVLLASARLPASWKRRAGGWGLVVLGLSVASGLYGALVERVILHWPATRLG